MSIEKMLWWKDSVFCGHCKSTNVFLLEKKQFNQYKCIDCDKTFNIFTNTPFKKTKLTEDQWEIILTNLDADVKPSHLCKKVGVHHWTMSKIMTKIRENMCGEIDPEIIKGFNKSCDEIASCMDIDNKDDKDYDALKVILAFKYYNRDHIAAIQQLTGLPNNFITKCVANITKSWKKGEEFIDENGSSWAQDKNPVENKIALTIDIMCVLGTLERDKISGVMNLSKEEAHKESLKCSRSQAPY